MSCAASCAAPSSRGIAPAWSIRSCRGTSTRSSRRWARPTRSSRPNARTSSSGSWPRRRASARTLEQGLRQLDDLLVQGEVPAAEAFKLHDTYGFPIELTREIAEERGVAFSEQDEFDRLMDEQRARSAAGKGRGKAGATAEIVRGLGEFETQFTGYEALEQHTTVGALEQRDGQVLVKLAESPSTRPAAGRFPMPGSSSASTATAVRASSRCCAPATTRRSSSSRSRATLHDGERVIARVDPATRHATEANHTATHLLHAALRARLGAHVRQAGSYVGPDKLRFDFTHGKAHEPEELRDVEDEVNAKILENPRCARCRRRSTRPRRWARWRCSARSTATWCGWSRSATGRSRVSCAAARTCARPRRSGCSRSWGRPPARPTCAASRRSPGPRRSAYMRARDELLRARRRRRCAPRPSASSSAWPALQEQAKTAAKAARQRRRRRRRARGARHRGGRRNGARRGRTAADAKALLGAADRVKGRLGDAAIVLGAAVEGRVHLVAAVAPALVERGVKAGAIVKVAAEVAGGGGGGRDTMAQAGGRDPRSSTRRSPRLAPRSRPRSREAGCACWRSTTAARAAGAPSATPRARWRPRSNRSCGPATRRGFARVVDLVRDARPSASSSACHSASPAATRRRPRRRAPSPPGWPAP